MCPEERLVRRDMPRRLVQMRMSLNLKMKQNRAEMTELNAK